MQAPSVGLEHSGGLACITEVVQQAAQRHSKQANITARQAAESSQGCPSHAEQGSACQCAVIEAQPDHRDRHLSSSRWTGIWSNQPNH